MLTGADRVLGATEEDVQRTLVALDRLVARARTAPPLPPEAERSLLDDFTVRYAHETTALEGNTLDLVQARVLLVDGLTVAGKTFREHLEVANAREAFLWSRQVTTITEETMFEAHRILMQGLIGDEAGHYRKQTVFIAGSRHVPPNWVRVPERMAEFLDWLAAGPGAVHPVAFAAEAHIRLAAIHPFLDGSGRVSRLVTGVLLAQHGYPPPLYRSAQRDVYLKALETAQVDGNSRPFVVLTAHAASVLPTRQLRLVEAQRAESLKQPEPPTLQR